MPQRKKIKNKKLIYILAVFVAVQVLIILLVLPARKPGKEVVRPVLKPKGLIAIVLDDFGYNVNNLDELASIKQRLTVSILPNLPFSGQVAERLHGSNFEVILHFPMQPKENLKLEHNTILVGMEKTEIINILDKDLLSVRYAKGISNHMGSAATEDEKTLGIIFSELKKKHLYFLDSYVTGDSKGFIVARKFGIPFAKRDVFLDNSNEPSYIRGQLSKLKSIARANGRAIGIGHDRKNTIEVLKEELPRLEKEGYKFVFISQLTK